VGAGHVTRRCGWLERSPCQAPSCCTATATDPMVMMHETLAESACDGRTSCAQSTQSSTTATHEQGCQLLLSCVHW
jgi:hypothetical protein